MELFRLLGTIAIKNDEAIAGIKETAQEAQKAESKMSNAFKTIGQKSTALGQKMAKVSLAAGAAFSGIMVGITKTYADYEQLVGGVETLFGKSSDKLLEYANQAYKTAGLSANAYMETATSFSASLLQSLSGDTAKAVEYADLAIRDMSDNANKMGTDMELIQNAYQGFAKQNFMMLDNLKLGYGGTKEEMQRLLEDAEKIKAKNGEMVEYSIDSYADMVEAIHVVQEEMGITGTTAAEAEKTISGSWNALKGAWTNFLTEFGKAGADMDKVYEQLEESAENFAENIGKLIGRVFDNSPFLVIGAALLGLLAIMSPVLIAFGSLMSGIGAIIPLLPKLSAGFATLGKAMFATPIGLVLTGITALVTAFIYLWNNCEGFREFWINLWENIKAKFFEAKDKLIEGKNKIVEGFNSVVDFFKNNWKELLLLIVNPFAGAFALLYKHNDKFRAKVDALKTAVVNIWGKIKDGIVSKIETARDKVKNAIYKMKSFFNFSWSLPKLKLPHIDISGKFSLNPPKVPKFSIKWYKKAMDEAMLLNSPTIFGYGDGQFLGGGEAGQEVVAGSESLMNMVRTAVASEISRTHEAIERQTMVLGQYLSAIRDNIGNDLVLDTGALVGGTKDAFYKEMGIITATKSRRGLK